MDYYTVSSFEYTIWCRGERMNAGQRQKPVVKIISKTVIDKKPFYRVVYFLYMTP